MANWLQEQGVRARRLRRLHAPAHAGVPRALSRSGSSTCTRRSCPSSPARARSTRRSRPASRRPASPCTSSTRASTPARVHPPGARAGRAARDARRADPRGRAPAAAGGGGRAVRALISVYDKTGLDGFAKGLAVARLRARRERRHGRAPRGARAGRDARREPDRVPGAARRPREDAPPARSTPASSRAASSRTDVAALDEHGIEPIDLVCVNLYPFERVARAAAASREAETIEMIDIGGPSLLRGAAKNHAHVAPVCRPEDYEHVLAELRTRDGELSLETRRRLAGDRVRDDRRLRGGDRALVRRGRGVPADASSPSSRRSATSRTARTRIRAPRTTPSAEHARTCSRGSSSCTGASSRSTT